MVRFNKSVLRLKLPSSSSIHKQNQREPKKLQPAQLGLRYGYQEWLATKRSTFHQCQGP